jgi:hypothetical protein
MSWDPKDPRSKSPVAGEKGHFDHHEWVKEGLIELHMKIDLLAAAIARLEKRPKQ